MWTGPVSEEEAAAVHAAKVEAGWVHRAVQPTPPHECPFPHPPGAVGDLWRCYHCRKLWRVKFECMHQLAADVGHVWRGDHCDPTPNWELASWWQRLRYRREGRPGRYLPPPMPAPPPPPSGRVAGTGWRPEPAQPPRGRAGVSGADQSGAGIVPPPDFED